jgi:hypothetical protein
MVGGSNLVIAFAEHEHYFIADGVLAGWRDEHEEEDHSLDRVLPDLHEMLQT